MNSSFTRAAPSLIGDGNRTAAAVGNLRQRDAQFAVAQRRGGPGRVDGDVDADGAGEAAEVALDQMEARRALRPRLGPVLLAGDDDHTGRDHDSEIGGRDARDVEHQLEGVVGLEDVEEGQAFAGDLVTAVWTLAGQLVEQLADVARDVADVGGDRKA